MMQRFRNRVAEYVGAGFFAVIMLIGLAGLTRGNPVESTAYIVLGGGFLVRALRSSDVVVASDEVRTRSILRTRRLRYRDLSGAEVAIGPVGLGGYRREFVVFHRTDGSAFAFRDLNARVTPEGRDSEVRRAAACINEHLHGPTA